MTQRRFYWLALLFSGILTVALLLIDSQSDKLIFAPVLFVVVFWFADMGVKAGRTSALRDVRNHAVGRKPTAQAAESIRENRQ